MEATGAKKRKKSARRVAVEATGGGRCAKRRKTLVKQEQHRISCLDLRSRNVVLKPRIARPAADPDVRRCRSRSVLGRVSRCSSSAASSEASPLPLPEKLVFSRHSNPCSGESEQIDMSASINHDDEASDLESTAEGESRRRSTVEPTPSAAELEDFFSAAENKLRRRFSERYNFDVLKDAPFLGRFEWIPLTP